jgi:hypothetical protein
MTSTFIAGDSRTPTLCTPRQLQAACLRSGPFDVSLAKSGLCRIRNLPSLAGVS